MSMAYGERKGPRTEVRGPFSHQGQMLIKLDYALAVVNLICAGVVEGLVSFTMTFSV